METKVTINYGTSKSRAWLEAEVLPSGDLLLIGMGSRTDFDENGKVTAHKTEPTGARMVWPAATERRSWWQRLFA